MDLRRKQQSNASCCLTSTGLPAAMKDYSRILSILPCAGAPEYCDTHSVERNEPLNRGLLEKPSALVKRFVTLMQGSRRKGSPLFSLPVELLYKIVEYLDIHERVAVTVTCKALYSTLGTSPFITLKKENPGEFLNLLTVLQRDRQATRLCSPCQTLHSPSASTMTLPRNKLRRSPFHPALKVYVLAPDEADEPDVVYWLSSEHMSRILTHQICISTLHCAGSVDLKRTLPSIPSLVHGTFHFTFKPVITRRTLIHHAMYTISLVPAPYHVWSKAYTRHLLRDFDIRCCLHCSNEHFLDEITCYLFHVWDETNMLLSEAEGGCRRRGYWAADEGCAHHGHAGECECVSEYRIEKVQGEEGVREVGFKVLVWQWLGRGDDVVLRQKGMLRNLYEGALYWEKRDEDLRIPIIL